MARKKTSSNSNAKRRTNAKSTTRGGTQSRRSSSSKNSRRSSRRSSRSTAQPFRLNVKQKMLIVGILLIFLTAVIVLSLLSPNQGQLTAALSGAMWRLFGWGGVFLPLGLGAAGFYLVLWGMEQQPPLPIYRLAGLLLLFLTFEMFAAMIAVRANESLLTVWETAQAATGGGYLGALLASSAIQAVGAVGAVFTFLVIGFVAAVMALGVTRQDFGQFLNRLWEWVQGLRQETVDITREVDPSRREIKINPGRNRSRAPEQPLLIDVDEPAAAVNDPAPAEAAAAAQARPARSSRRKEPVTPAPAEPTAPTPIFITDSGRRAAAQWELPRLAEMLEAGSDQDLNNASIREQVEIIEHTLESFGAPASVVEINQGPTITQFGVEPRFIEQRSGKRTKVKVGKIASLADDLALALAARSIRIQAPVPGKGYVGIEVPNTSKALVSLRDVMESPEFLRIKSPLRIGLGQNVAGQPIAADLSAMPHLLIAGTTGSGKSVCVNGIIACLLLQNTPEDLKLVLVDPKRVELTGYNGVPHLAAPVVVDMERVIGTLQWAMREMDNRYKLFADIGARNIADYNQKIKGDARRDKLPFIVIVIDELADLMMISPEDTERGVTRLAQMARATGIHMVIATQRPSVDVVTGLIKANFPARVAFAVASSTDSRVILDTTGAERLLGQGDMLFQSPDAAAPVRMQGCFVSDHELQKLIDYWQTARRFHLIGVDSPPAAASTPVPAAAPAAAPTRSSSPPAERPAENQPAESQPAERPSTADRARPTPPPPDAGPAPPEIDVLTSEVKQQPLWEELQRAEAEAQYEDELMPEAIALVRDLNKASTSLLQRRFRIGYTRAARLIDQMEEDGIIGPPTGTSKAREVLPWGNDDGQAAEADETTGDDA